MNENQLQNKWREVHRAILEDIGIDILRKNCADCYDEETHRVNCDLDCISLLELKKDSFCLKNEDIFFEGSNTLKAIFEIGKKHGYNMCILFDKTHEIKSVKFYNV